MVKYRSKGNLPQKADYYALLNRNGAKASNINILDSSIYATGALGLNYELTHAYFDKSDTDIWEDFIRNSINYDSENTNRWHVDELNPSYLEKYIKPDYRNKIFCGIDKGDYAGAIMVFESGIPEILKKDLRFWRKRKYFEVATRKIDIEPGIEYTLTGKSDSAIITI